MIEITERDGKLHVVDVEKNELVVGTRGWRRGGDPHGIDRDIDGSITGTATALRFPKAGICVDSAGREQWRTYLNPTAVALGADTHLIQIETQITAYVAFDGTAELYHDAGEDEIVVAFPGPTGITLGFRALIRRPRDGMVVPPTPEGVATALSYLSVAHKTTAPDRSYPTLRDHPPRIELGDEVAIPAAIRDAKSGTDIELRAPPDRGTLFVLAPLAYYLQADVSVDGGPPRLCLPEVGVERELPPLPGLQGAVVDLLRRAFLLDCLVRNEGPYGTELAEVKLLDAMPFDPATAYHARPDERLATYLEAPFDRIDADLPDWHLATYVEPTTEHVPMLPHLLDRLSLVYLPRARELGRGELLERSLDAFYRSTAGDRATGEAAAVDLLEPTHGRGRVRGWLADGVPIDAFKMLPEAYENRFTYLGAGDGPVRVTVVLNDEEMSGEQSEVQRIYEERGEELSLDVSVRRRLTRDELADVFETSREFVHYIGHCDERGLRCVDGHLAVEELAESNVQTFFLNACGSYHEGIELVRKGSVAGGVTLDEVLNAQAVKVGTAFAQLVTHGFSVQLALQIARSRSIVNKNYVVVGDGTHTLLQGYDNYPSTLHINYNGECGFQITIKGLSPQDFGIVYQSYLSNDNVSKLFDNKQIFTLSKRRLSDFIADVKTACFFDGDYYWSDDLYEKLSETA